MKWLINTRGTIHPHRVGAPIRAFHEEFCKVSDFPVKETLYINIGDKMWWNWNKAEIIGLGKNLLIKLEVMPDQARYFNKIKGFVDKAITSSENIRHLNLSLYSNNELIKLYKEHYEGCKEAHAIMNTDIDAFDFYPADYLRDLIKSELPDELNTTEKNEIILKLTTPAYCSFVSEEEIAILQLVSQVRKGVEKSKIEKELQKIERKYWWVTLGWESMRVKTSVDYKNDLERYLDKVDNPDQKIAEIKKNVRQIKSERKNIIKKYKISEEIKNLIGLFDVYAYYHDLRKEMQVRTTYSFYLLLSESAKRLSYNVDDLEWLWPEEVCDLLKGKTLYVEEINRRKKAIAIKVDEKGITTVSGDQALEIKSNELDEDVGYITEIKGITASVGLTKGKVKVCNGAEDALEKIKEGDILVTGMTLPDYVPAMRKAAAIITDEGGITCHAAIISRELKKPCITGTKISTQALEDGMMVEVDADKGIIKIIK